jgi:hypothetical protein
MAKFKVSVSNVAVFKVTVPFVDDMGSISPFVVMQTLSESKAQAALWHINKMRDHDGLPQLSRMPNGTTYTRVTD